MGRPVLNQIGNRSKNGNLVVVERAGYKYEGKQNRPAWLCRCLLCGKTVILTASNLRCQESCGCAKRLLPGEAAKNALFGRYRQNSTKRNLTWELSSDEFFKLTSMPCSYCVAPPHRKSRTSKNGHVIYTGLDRVDNKEGYTISNIVPCCHTCNHAKACMSKTDFVSWILRAAKNLMISAEPGPADIISY